MVSQESQSLFPSNLRPAFKKSVRALKNAIVSLIEQNSPLSYITTCKQQICYSIQQTTEG